MKEIDGWVKIKKYTDDGKPVCLGCGWRSPWNNGCVFSVIGLPGPTCPVWHGESKGDIVALMEEIAVNKETGMAAGPEPQFDADEPRYSVHITGPERLLAKLADLFFELQAQENKPWTNHSPPANTKNIIGIYANLSLVRR